MTTDAYRSNITTRQRITSTFLNRSVALGARNLQEALRFILGVDVSRGGVIGGLTVSINAATMTVTVAAGLGLLVDAAMVHPDSQYRWVELTSGSVVNIPAADPANPRWDVVEIQPANVTVGAALRDQFNPTTGGFSQVSMDEEFRPNPTITVRSGTAAAVPLFPAGIAGRIPLAYVYVPAAAAALTVGDVVHCRPVLKASDDTWESGVLDVRGGGVAVASVGTTVGLRQCSGRFANHRAPFGIGVSGSTISLAVPAAGWDGGSAPVADTPAYFYACAAPYPTGYDSSLAAREFRPEANAVTRFASALPVGVSGCVVIASLQPPNTGTMQGAPVGGTPFALAGGPWAASASIPSAGAVYLGAAFYDVGTSQFQVQTEHGGRVLLTANKPVLDLIAGGVFASGLTSVRGVAGTDAFMLPASALDIKATLFVSALSTLTAFTFEFRDETRNNTPASTEIRMSSATLFDSAGGIQHTWDLDLRLNASGQVDVSSMSATPGVGDLGQLYLAPTEYRDAVISRR